MQEVAKSDFRNQGIDLLRVIAMMMVVAFHFLDEGGVLDNLQKMGGGMRYSMLFGRPCFHALTCLP